MASGGYVDRLFIGLLTDSGGPLPHGTAGSAGEKPSGSAFGNAEALKRCAQT
jgi:hypothetical protein